MKQLKIKKLNPKAKLPTRAHSTDCGADIFCLEGAILNPGEGKLFKTGIAGEFPVGFVGMICDRSSMAKRGLKVAGGIVDPGFTGELGVVLRNITSAQLTITEGDKIAQLLMIPVATPEIIEVAELPNSERGIKGWGSSGI